VFVLLGEHSPAKGSVLESHLHLHHWGRMWSRDKIRRCWPGELFGFDNGAFSAWRNNDAFPDERFLVRLANLCEQPKANCIIAVVPDLVAEGLKSLAFSMWWLPRLPSEYPWHLAVQDGMRPADVEPHIHRFAGLLLGGTDDFKRRAKEWCDFAHDHGKRFHWARCYSIRNVEEAHHIGADSIDSTFAPRAFAVGRDVKAKAWLKAARHGTRQRQFETT